MNLDLPVFPVNPLKKLFFYFFAAVILIGLVSVLVVAVIPASRLAIFQVRSVSWGLIIGLFAFSYFFDLNSRRQLKKVNENGDIDALIEEYIKFYKTRVIWNAVSVLLTATLFILTFKNIYFYILLFQVAFAFVFFPRKIQITKDLQEREFLFI